MMAQGIFTIGHSNHSIEKVLELLTANGITAIADVRSHPYSRYNPQFNRENLRAALKVTGISYVFVGRELGARSDDRTCYRNGTVQYDLIAGTDLFQEGLTRVADGAKSHRIALMCAEKDPLTCHRAILVSRHLIARGISVDHILASGRLESHDAALQRLLTELSLEERDLFRTREDLIAEAYEQRGRQIAYTEMEPVPMEPAFGEER